jgi:hypothetical protein
MENEMPQDHDPKHVKPTGVMQARLAQIDRLAPTTEKLSDAELQRKTLELKDRLRAKREGAEFRKRRSLSSESSNLGGFDAVRISPGIAVEMTRSTGGTH